MPTSPDAGPGRAALRKLLGIVLVLDADLDAFCLDYFPEVKRRFSSGMDRVSKVNLLLELETTVDTLNHLRRFAPDKVAKHEHLLQEESPRMRQLNALREQLESAHAEKEQLTTQGQDTSKLDTRILDLRRQQRSSPQLNEGEILAERYRLVEIVGRGGFAHVWQAYDRNRKQMVAIKILHSQWNEDQSRIERFTRGAVRMASLNHPHIARVLSEPLEYEGFHYFVMEYLPGGDLHHAVRERAISQAQAFQVILQAGEALSYAHHRNLIHRDVKPHNILLGEEVTAKITDFDLVLVQDSTGGTRTGPMGTFIYASAEELDDAKRVDHRTDIYSLGMCIVFVLYGRSLPKSAFQQTDNLIMQLECTNNLKECIRKAVAWDAEHRFSTMDMFCAELRKAIKLDSSPPVVKLERSKTYLTVITDLPQIVERFPEPSFRPGQLLRKHPFLAGIGAAASVGLIAIVAEYKFSVFRPVREAISPSPASVHAIDLGQTMGYPDSGVELSPSKVIANVPSGHAHTWPARPGFIPPLRDADPVASSPGKLGIAEAQIPRGKPSSPATQPSRSLSQETIRQIMQRAEAYFGTCVQEAWDSSISIAITVKASGHVQQAHIAGPLEKTETGRCISKYVMDLQFPPLTEGDSNQQFFWSYQLPAKPTAAIGKKIDITEFPRTFDQQMDLAQRLIEHKQFDEARRIFATIRSYADHVSAVHAGLAMCDLEEGRTDEAIVHYQDALSRLATYGPARFGLAQAYRQKGNTEKAIEWYKKYLEVNPSGGTATLARDAIAKLEGPPTGSDAESKALLEKGKESCRAGKIDEAKSIMSKLHGKDPDRLKGYCASDGHPLEQ